MDTLWNTLDAVAVPPAIIIPIAPRIRELASHLDTVGDKTAVAEAYRLADAVGFLESEIARYRASILQAHHFASVTGMVHPRA